MHRTIKEEGVLAMLGEDMNGEVDQPLVTTFLRYNGS
jgi:hypothetical protein